MSYQRRKKSKTAKAGSGAKSVGRSGVLRGPSRPAQSISSRAGVIFPVARVRRYMKQAMTRKQRIAAGAPLYLTAVMEYLTAEILELSGNAARDHKKKRIIPRHLMLAIKHDMELAQVCDKVTIANAGVVPHIELALVKKQLTIPIVKKLAVFPAGTGAAKTKKRGAPSKKQKAAPLAKQQSSLVGVPGGITILGERKLALGQTLTIISADIVNVTCDAIVHPTNDSLFLGGEVGTNLSNVGGQAFRVNVAQLYRNHGPLAKFSAAVCKGVNFAAPNVIHCNGPSWSGLESLGELTTTVDTCLRVADREKLASICFPSIGSGRAGFPKQAAAQTILRAISDYFKGLMSSSIKQIYFDLFDKDSVNVWKTELSKLDRNA